MYELKESGCCPYTLTEEEWRQWLKNTEQKKLDRLG